MSSTMEGFKDSERLTKWVQLFLYAQILVAAVSIVSGYLEYELLLDFQNGIYTSQEQANADADASDQRQQYVAFTYLAIYIISGFLILRWIHRANYNTHQLGAKNMKFTPGWSIGWYFVPIAAFYKPYQAMEEIWKASHSPSDWGAVKINYIMPLWWALWLITNFLGQAVFHMSNDANELDELIHVNKIFQVSDMLSILLAIVTLLLVNNVYQMQMRSNRNKLGSEITN